MQSWLFQPSSYQLACPQPLPRGTLGPPNCAPRRPTLRAPGRASWTRLGIALRTAPQDTGWARGARQTDGPLPRRMTGMRAGVAMYVTSWLCQVPSMMYRVVTQRVYRRLTLHQLAPIRDVTVPRAPAPARSQARGRGPPAISVQRSREAPWKLCVLCAHSGLPWMSVDVFGTRGPFARRRSDLASRRALFTESRSLHADSRGAAPACSREPSPAAGARPPGARRRRRQGIAPCPMDAWWRR